MRQFWIPLVLVALLLGVSVFSLGRLDAQDSGIETGSGSLPLFGMIENEDGSTSTFQGSVSDLVVSDDGGMVIDGLLNGLVITEDEAVRITDQEFNSSLTPNVTGSIEADELESGTSSGALTKA